MKGQEYNIQGLDEYIRQSEPQKRERGEAKILSEETTPIQSADSALNLPPKCKSCTLEEIAVLRIVQNNPNATQKEPAAEIGKSERTVKTIRRKGFSGVWEESVMGNGRLSVSREGFALYY